MVQEKHRGKDSKENKEVHKVKLFPRVSPDLITAPRWLLVQHFTFGVRRAFKFLSYSQRWLFFFFLKSSSLFCCLGCGPPGTLLVVGVGRGLFFLRFGLVKRIKITPARLSFTRCEDMISLSSTTTASPGKVEPSGVNKSGFDPTTAEEP